MSDSKGSVEGGEISEPPTKIRRRETVSSRLIPVAGALNQQILTDIDVSYLYFILIK